MTTPHPDWPKTLEWIEKQGQESLKSRFATADILSKEAQTTLTVLLAAIGGSAAYGAKIFETGAAGPLEVGAAFTCVYLVFLAVIFVRVCMTFRSYPAQYQNPLNLRHPLCSIDQIRDAELKNLEERINEAADINKRRAKRLNQFRIAAVISPVVFVTVALMTPATIKVETEPTKLSCHVGWSEAAVPGLKIECNLSR